jgi:hypothetical protein
MQGRDLNAIHKCPAVSFLFLWTASGVVGPQSPITSPQPVAGKQVEATVTILYVESGVGTKIRLLWLPSLTKRMG